MEAPGVLYKGDVTHVTDPSNFWMMIGSDNDFNDFRIYQATLDRYYTVEEGKNATIDINSLTEGDAVAVPVGKGRKPGKQGLEVHWRRAIVARILGDTVDVFYADLGYTEVVKVDRVRRIHERLFNYMTKQAIQVRLAGIKPLSRSWTTRAVKAFEEAVFEREVSVYIVEFEEAHGCIGTVFLYARGSDGMWYSITHLMLSKEMGMPTEYDVKACLDQDEVDRALAEQEQMHSEQYQEQEFEDQNQGDDLQNEELNPICTSTVAVEKDSTVHADSEAAQKLEAESDPIFPSVDVTHESPFNRNGSSGTSPSNHSVHMRDGNNIKNTQNIGVYDDYSMLDLKSDEEEEVRHPEQKPAFGKSLSKDHLKSFKEESESQSSPRVEIPSFNLSKLSQTKAIPISKMQEEKIAETQLERRAKLQADLRRCDKETEDVDSFDSNWDESDYNFATAFQYDNIHETINSEINRERLYHDHRAEAELFQRNHQSHSVAKSTKFASETSLPFPKTSQSVNTATTQPQRLSEEESYIIEKDIEKILVDNSDADLKCSLVHSIVEPDEDMPKDYLIAVITVILEVLMEKTCPDPDVALRLLESYSGAAVFTDSFLEVLRTLKNRFLKLPQSVRIQSNHEEFSDVLAFLYNQSFCWPKSFALEVQEFILSNIERCLIFNKHRQQDGEAVLQTELMYLSCVTVFIENAFDFLRSEHSQCYLGWLEEMRLKLIGDGTHRIVRSKLLDLLLKLQKQQKSDVRKQPTATDAACQTDFTHIEEQSSGSMRSGKYKRQDHENTSSPALYKAPRGCPVMNSDSFKDYTPNAFQNHPNDDVPTHFLQQDSQYNYEGIQSDLETQKLDSHRFPRAENVYDDTSVRHPDWKAQENDFNEKFSALGVVDSVTEAYGYEDAESQRSHNELIAAQNALDAEQHSEHVATESQDYYDIREETLEEKLSSKDVVKSKKDDCEFVVNQMQTAKVENAEEESEVMKKSDDPFLAVSNDDGRDGLNADGVNMKKIIRYTSQELKDLNPYKDLNPEQLPLITEPAELAHLFRLENEKRALKNFQKNFQMSTATATPLNEGSFPSQRYTGNSVEPPIQLSTGPNSNFAQWKSLSELLPSSPLDELRKKQLGSSVDPSRTIENQNDESERNVNNSGLEGKMELKSSKVNEQYRDGSLQDDEIAMKGKLAFEGNELKDLSANQDTAAQELTGNSAPLSKENNSSLKQSGKPVWPSDFFKSARLRQENKNKDTMGAAGDAESEFKSPSPVASSQSQGKKKKKTKFRPLNDFLIDSKPEDESRNDDDQYPARRIHDDFAFSADEDSDDEDLFSPEAIARYEALERMQKEEELIASGSIIHQPRIGITSGSTGARESLFREARKRPPQPKQEAWVPSPGGRKCTRCGSEKHLVYECPKSYYDSQSQW